MRIQRCVLVLTTLLSTPALFASQRTFVSAEIGVDTNPCTRVAPCRSFTAALAVTDSDGEVIAVDSGGYGPATIAQAVSITAPRGVQAGVTATSGNAITINTLSSANVLLKNLSLTGAGATYGVNVQTVGSLVIDGCTTADFSLRGISFLTSNSGARLLVIDSVVRRSFDAGIVIGSTNGRAMLDAVSIVDCSIGVDVVGTDVMIRNSIVAGANTSGFTAAPFARLVIANSIARGNAIGFEAYSSGVLVMSNCTAVDNYLYGVEARQTNTIIDIAGSTIAMNATGIAMSGGGTVNSRGNNTLESNTTDGAFSALFAAQ